MPFVTAISTEHGDDAHVVLYSMLNQALQPSEEQYRLTKQGVQSLIDQQRCTAAQFGGALLGLDVDLPKEAEWTPELVVEWQAKLHAAAELNPIFSCPTVFYATKHGFRLLWLLRRRCPIVDPNELEDRLRGLVTLAHLCGIPADEACKDWTRLFRLPRVHRVLDNGTIERTAMSSYFRLAYGAADLSAHHSVPADGRLIAYEPEVFPRVGELDPKAIRACTSLSVGTRKRPSGASRSRSSDVFGVRPADVRADRVLLHPDGSKTELFLQVLASVEQGHSDSGTYLLAALMGQTGQPIEAVKLLMAAGYSLKGVLTERPPPEKALLLFALVRYAVSKSTPAPSAADSKRLWQLVRRHLTVGSV